MTKLSSSCLRNVKYLIHYTKVKTMRFKKDTSTYFEDEIVGEKEYEEDDNEEEVDPFDD